MRLISRLRDRCFCAFCRAERNVYVKKHADLTNVLGAIIFAGVLTQAWWGRPDPGGVMIFGAMMVSAEIFVYLRWRFSLTCTLCGFDPLIYKRSPERAARKVRAFYDDHMGKPEFLFSRSPLVALQRQQRINERQSERAKRSTPASSLLPPPKSL